MPRGRKPWGPEADHVGAQSSGGPLLSCSAAAGVWFGAWARKIVGSGIRPGAPRRPKKAGSPRFPFAVVAVVRFLSSSPGDPGPCPRIGRAFLSSAWAADHQRLRPRRCCEDALVGLILVESRRANRRRSAARAAANQKNRSRPALRRNSEIELVPSHWSPWPSVPRWLGTPWARARPGLVGNPGADPPPPGSLDSAVAVTVFLARTVPGRLTTSWSNPDHPGPRTRFRVARSRQL